MGRLLMVLFAMHAAAAAVSAQVRVTVANVPAGVSVQAILNAGNDSKPLPPTERSGGNLTFAMLADSANFGKQVQVYLVKEEDDDDRPAGVFFVIDNGAVPPNGRLVDTFTLTAQITDILVDYQTGMVMAGRDMEDAPGATSPLLGQGWQVGLYADWIKFTNAGGDDVCQNVPAGSTSTNCDLRTSGGGVTISGGYMHRRNRIGAGFGVAYSTLSSVSLIQTIVNNANPNLTAARDFLFDPKALEMSGRVAVWTTPRIQLSARAGLAYVSSTSKSTFETLAGGTVVNTQTTTTDNASWSPAYGASVTVWANELFGFDFEYGWTRLKDGDVNEPSHRVSGGVRVSFGSH